MEVPGEQRASEGNKQRDQVRNGSHPVGSVPVRAVDTGETEC